MIRIWLIAVIAAFTVGFGSGLYFSHDYYHVASLKAQVKSYQDQRVKLREALGLNEQLDDQDSDAEANNEEVLRAIRDKQKTQTPVDVKLVNTVCVPADRMFDLSRLR